MNRVDMMRIERMFSFSNSSDHQPVSRPGGGPGKFSFHVNA
jgi:hypothetical protein